MSPSSTDDPFNPLRAFKVVVSFSPIGSAPRLKVSKFTVEGTCRVAELVTYLSSMVKQDDVHLYVANSIEPMGDQFLADLAKLFGKHPTVDGNGSINVHYSIGKAYL